MPLTFVAIAGLSLAAVAAEPSRATHNQEDALNRYIAVAHAVCLAPSDYGFDVHGHAAFDLKTKLTKLVAKLFSVNIATSLSGDGNYWKGAAQHDYAKALSSSNECAQNVFIGLLRTPSTDLVTHQRIHAPGQPERYFRSRSTQVFQSRDLPNALSVTSTSSPGFTGVNAGTVTINVSGEAPDPRISNRDKISALAIMVKSGNQIGQLYVDDKDAATIAARFNQWTSVCDAYLNTAMDPGYSARFEAAQSSSSSYLTGYPVAGSAIYNNLHAKLDVLSSFITELQHR